MNPNKLTVKRFISKPIDVKFLQTPLYSKKPTCPNCFSLKGKTHTIVDCLAEFKDFSRHGKMAKNMQPQHAQVAETQGSWGVGRFYFDVKTDTGKYFRLYYDRSPKNALDRAGKWILFAELKKLED